LYNQISDEIGFAEVSNMSGDQAMNACEDFFKKVVDKLGSDKRLVLLIDEFTYFYDQLQKHLLDNSFMRFWKAFIQNTRVSAVLIGQDFMTEFMNEYANEFGASEKIRIKYLDKESTRQLICEPFERCNGNKTGFSDDAVDRIYELTAGNAYYTMGMCGALVDYLNEIKRSDIVTKYVVNQFLQNKWLNMSSSSDRKDQGYFDSLYSDGLHSEWNDDNLAILSAIAVNDLDRVAGYYKRPSYKEKIDRLIDRDVLVQDGNGVHIKVKLFEEWLAVKNKNLGGYIG
jgi:hypothetical protein